MCVLYNQERKEWIKMQMNKILEEDIKKIATSKQIDWKKFKNKNLLITGANGLICSLITRAFLYRDNNLEQNTKLFLSVRSAEKTKELFGESQYIEILESDIEDINKLEIAEKIDYIIHGASPTTSKFFVNNPVETINTAILGTKNILEIAYKNDVKSMVYMSSMEMYGTFYENINVNEKNLGYINPLDVRSSYSEGKRMCELYSFSYFKEYNVPVKMARIAQTFGPGISKNETRVYKYFLDCILNNQDIILKSTGSTIINFSYTVDTVIGILYILLNGMNGEAYNIVSDPTNMTIYDSAKWLIETFGNGKIQVKCEAELQQKAGLAPDNKMILENNKLKEIGWENKYTLQDGYKRLFEYLKIENVNKVRKT